MEWFAGDSCQSRHGVMQTCADQTRADGRAGHGDKIPRREHRISRPGLQFDFLHDFFANTEPVISRITAAATSQGWRKIWSPSRSLSWIRAVGN